jgi:hypothetical protein
MTEHPKSPPNTTRTRCPGSHDPDPPRRHHGFGCCRCDAWWLAQLVIATGYLPAHTIANPKETPQP